jgi:hypothetical protein
MNATSPSSFKHLNELNENSLLFSFVIIMLIISISIILSICVSICICLNKEIKCFICMKRETPQVAVPVNIEINIPLATIYIPNNQNLDIENCIDRRVD